MLFLLDDDAEFVVELATVDPKRDLEFTQRANGRAQEKRPRVDGDALLPSHLRDVKGRDLGDDRVSVVVYRFAFPFLLWRKQKRRNFSSSDLKMQA